MLVLNLIESSSFICWEWRRKADFSGFFLVFVKIEMARKPVFSVSLSR